MHRLSRLAQNGILAAALIAVPAYAQSAGGDFTRVNPQRATTADPMAPIESSKSATRTQDRCMGRGFNVYR